MKAKAKTVAITRWGKTICSLCVSDADEVAVITDPENNVRLMEEQKIAVVRADELKGTEKCAICGKKIEA